MENWIWLLVAWVVYQVIRSNSQKKAATAAVQTVVTELRTEVEKGLTINIAEDVYEPEGAKIDVIRVVASGTVAVPHDGHQVVTTVVMADVTDGEDDDARLPVMCSMPESANENGILYHQNKQTVPYQVTELKDITLLVVPRRALHLPKRGLREIMVIVGITSAINTDDLISGGQKKIQYNNQTIGYMEIDQAQQEQEELIAVLALSVAAADGHVAKAEKRVIRAWFNEHFAGKESDEEATEHVNDAMRSTFGMVEQDPNRAMRLATETAAKMREFGSASYVRRAYELCVGVAMADGMMNLEERKALGGIAKELGLSEEDVRVVHDQQVSWRRFSEDELLLEIPAEHETNEDKLKWVNEQYARWRTRVGHRDPAKAAEAQLRVERLVQMRHRLEGNNNDGED